jgi:anti-sigma factor RsiW
MNCARTRQVIDAYLDAELDRATRLELTEHLAQCPDCARIHAERDALSQRVRATGTRYSAPPALLARLRQVRDSHARPVSFRKVELSWLQAIAVAFALVGMGVLVGHEASRFPAQDPTQEMIVANHVASLRDGHPLVDVASESRHVVKPWLQGKIDFSPQVRDLARHGYTLAGARLDRFGGQASAAIVYRVRDHVINVFAWRADADAAAPTPVVSKVRGFSVVSWSDGGLRYAAISDIDAAELHRFSLLMIDPPSGDRQ